LLTGAKVYGCQMRAKYVLFCIAALVAIFAGVGAMNGLWANAEVRGHAADGIKTALGLPYGFNRTDAPIRYHLATQGNVDTIGFGFSDTGRATQMAAADVSRTDAILSAPEPPEPPQSPEPAEPPQSPESPQLSEPCDGPKSAEIGAAENASDAPVNQAQAAMADAEVAADQAAERTTSMGLAREMVDVSACILKDVEAGKFSRISVRFEGEVPRCGAPNLVPDCEPLTPADKARIVKDARAEHARAKSELWELQKQ
jgi:hypothetical protein